MQGLLELGGEFGQAFKGEQIAASVLRMTPVAEPFQLTQLGWPQPACASCEVSLLQELNNQAPAERSPRDSPGMRVR